MPLRIKTEQTAIEIQVSQDMNDKRLFNLDLSDIGSTQIKYPFSILENHFEEIDNYDIYLFKNRLTTTERDIYQINIDKGSIAWMLPLSIYDSGFDFDSEISQYANNLNLQAKNTFFLKKVAYPVFHKLLLAKDTPSKMTNHISDISDYNLFDFYDKDTNVLIVSKERLKTLNLTFNLDIYLPSLYKYGYVQLDAQEDFDDIYFLSSSRNPNFKNFKIFEGISINLA